MSQQLSLLSAHDPALHDRQAMLALLDSWQGEGWLRVLDVALARFCVELDPHSPPLLLLGAALSSLQLGHGHVCLDLAACLAEPGLGLSVNPSASTLPPARLLQQIRLDDWLSSLQQSPLAGTAEAGNSPLVLDGQRLYLRRYWNYEQTVAEQIAARLPRQQALPATFSMRLQELFSSPPEQHGKRLCDWQKVACALAARSAFSLITGGPGTGKTTSVVRLLALLQEAALQAGQPLRIQLAAPTGKAAARLSESIGAQVAALPVSEAVRELIPRVVTTLHRLLGSLPDSRHFRHHAGNPLALDVLVVDEASMIDLEMMACLLDALPATARLILLGDKDQLASVEAGALLGDLCRDAEYGYYAADLQHWLEQVSGERLDDPQLRPGSAQTQPLAQHTLMLRHSRRFAGHSGIGQLARAVNQGNAADARQILASPAADLQVLRLHGSQQQALAPRLLDGHDAALGYAHYLQVMQQQRPSVETADQPSAWLHWARQVLAAFEQFQLLCALRQGPWGVEGLNTQIAAALLQRGLLDSDQGWYEGRPVMVTRNDYNLGLMNGDIGIALCMPDSTTPSRQVLRVVFPRNDGQQGLRLVLPSRLSAVETVYAMTVHKSQGSEFAHCALLLPDTLNPVLTRELIYTGITRAREHFTLIESHPAVFEQAIQRRVQRHSGLLDALRQATAATIAAG